MIQIRQAPADPKPARMRPGRCAEGREQGCDRSAARSFPGSSPASTAPSLLQNTFGRASGANLDAPVLITAEDRRFLVRDQVEDAEVNPECIILELEQQDCNTAPALAVAAK